MCDKRHAEHALGFLLHVRDGFDDLDATTLAATTGVDLSFHDPDRSAQFPCGGDRFGNAECRLAARHGSAEAAEVLLGLIFMDIHREPGALGWRIARHNSSRP